MYHINCPQNSILQLLFKLRIFLLLILISLLASCSYLFNSLDGEQQSIKNVQYRIIDNWRISGRISIINEHENWYAKFNWLQKGNDFQIRFTGPLGETQLQIGQIDHVIRLKTPSGESTGDDLELLLLQKTGWKFPLSSLKYWLQGQPNPNASAKIKQNQHQQISHIFQSGWDIQYKKRMSVKVPEGMAIILPKKIIAIEQDIKIKLIITRWQLE